MCAVLAKALSYQAVVFNHSRQTPCANSKQRQRQNKKVLTRIEEFPFETSPAKSLCLHWKQSFDVSAATEDPIQVDPAALNIDPHVEHVMNAVELLLPLNGILFKHLAEQDREMRSDNLAERHTATNGKTGSCSIRNKITMGGTGFYEERGYMWTAVVLDQLWYYNTEQFISGRCLGSDGIV